MKRGRSIAHSSRKRLRRRVSRRGDHRDANFPAGLPLCAAHAARQRWCHPGDRRLTGDWHRRQHCDLQRRQRAPARATALSRSRSARRVVAALSWHQHPARLALAGSVHRHSEREPFLRGDVDFSRPKRNAGRPGSAGTSRSAEHILQPVPSAGSAAALRAAAASRRGHAWQTAGRDSQLQLLAAALQFRSEHCRQEHHAERHRCRFGNRQESVHGRRRAPTRVPVERRSDAHRFEHQTDGRVPATAIWS